MAQITKSISGELYTEDFAGDISLIWDLMPGNSDRVAINSDSISLLPGDEKVELLIPSPRDLGYVLQTKIDYKPTKPTERAGCILKSITENYAEVEICGDDLETCTYFKLELDLNAVFSVKAADENLVWKDYGNTKLLDANKIGYYLNSEDALNDEPFKIYNCVMYKDNFITINHYDRNNVVRIYNANDNEITDKFVIRKTNTKLLIDGSNTIFPIEKIKMKFFDMTTGILVHEGELENVYGGDIYDFSYNIEFYIDSVILDDSQYNLGVINGVQYYNLRIVNKENFAINDKILKIEAISKFNPGHKVVDMAHPNDQNNFTKERHISLTAGETKEFVMRVTKNKDHLITNDDYSFKIVLD